MTVLSSAFRHGTALSCGALCFLAACATSRPPIPAVDAPLGWQLTWSDEFNGSTLDQESWTPVVMPEPFNEELQYYTDRVDDAAGANAWLEDGALVIEARREDHEHRRYTSARLNTEGKREFRYGRFEARIKQPGEVGMWPAFWLFGNTSADVGWPRNGEIDVMEGKGRLPSWTSVAIHGGPDPENNRATAAEYTLASGSFHDEWHVFAVEWSPASMRWYVDDVLFQQVEKPTGEDPAYWPFDNGHSFFIILNLAVGGRFDNPHRPPENLTPQRLYVDFVRVYRMAEGQ